VAVADVTGDGTADIIAAPGSGGATNVYVYTPTGALQAAFNAATVNGQVTPIAREDGVRLATADLDGDGIRDLVSARGRGTRPVVTGIKLNAGAPTVIRTQDVFDSSFTGGVFVG
jgi:2-phospho-L-lactate guanylyltransferase (CobY/MobA/RfbA family)